MIVNLKLLCKFTPHLCMNPNRAVARIRDGKIVVCKKNYGSRPVSSWFNDDSEIDTLDLKKLLADENNFIQPTTNIKRVKKL